MTEPIQVLHVDDEPGFTEMVADFLEREDPRFEVGTASSAGEGRDQLDSEEFDCVVSDYDMPGQNGIEFLETIREDHPDLPFILYTGKGSEEVASEAISAGVTDYLQKESGTSQYAVLAHRIRNAIESYQSQKAVEDTEQKLSQLAEKTNEILFMFDSDWSELLFINSAYEDVWGQSIEELRANPESFLKNVHPEDQDIVEQTLERILDGKPTEVEHRILTDEDEVRWISSEAKPIFDDDGTFTRIVGFVRDITERKERERKFEEERAFVNQALDTLNDIFYVIGQDGELHRWNDRLADVTGYADEEIANMQPTDFFPDDQQERIVGAIDETLTTGDATIEAELLTKGGKRIPYEFVGSNLTDSDDELIGLIGIGRDITERKEREQELGELARYNQEIVENAPVGLFRLDAQMRITYENQRAEEIVGVPEGEYESPAIGKDLRDLPSVQETDAIEALNRLEAGESVAFGTAFESIFGKESYLSGRGIPLFDDGDFDGAIIMVVDITERKEREQILEQLRQNVTEVVWVSNPEKDSMDFISDSYEDIMGRSTESLRKDPLSFVDAIHPEDRAQVRSALKEQQQHPEDYEEIYRIIRPNGEQRWIHDRSSGVYEDGELTRIVGVATDITQRKEREQELQEEQHFINTALDTLADIFYVVSPDGEFLRWNDVFPKVTGYSDAKIAEMHPLEFFDEDDADVIQAFIEEVLEKGEATVEAELVTKDGTAIPYASRGRRVIDTDGELIGIAGISRDVTERKERERELQRQNERLETFATMVSHDLRNPLSVAEGRLELAIEEDDQEHLDAIAQAHSRMETLIDDLLTLAKAGEAVGGTEAVELGALVDGCWQNVDTGPATIDVETDATVQADETRLQQLLENLLRNAVEHGGTEVRVTVGSLPEGFYVEDNGPGIPPEERQDVLNPGYSTREEGTGFGLSIVRDIAEAHGWEIMVTEGSDGGARIEFTDIQVE